MGEIELCYYHTTVSEAPTSVELLQFGGVIKHGMQETLSCYYKSTVYFIKILEL